MHVAEYFMREKRASKRLFIAIWRATNRNRVYFFVDISENVTVYLQNKTLEHIKLLIFVFYYSFLFHETNSIFYLNIHWFREQEKPRLQPIEDVKRLRNDHISYQYHIINHELYVIDWFPKFSQYRQVNT